MRTRWTDDYYVRPVRSFNVAEHFGRMCLRTHIFSNAKGIYILNPHIFEEADFLAFRHEYARNISETDIDDSEPSISAHSVSTFFSVRHMLYLYPY